MKKVIFVIFLILTSCSNDLKNFDCSYQKSISVNSIRFSLYSSGKLEFNGKTAKNQKSLVISVKRGNYITVPVQAGFFSGILNDIKQSDSLCIDQDCDDSIFKNICLI